MGIENLSSVENLNEAKESTRVDDVQKILEPRVSEIQSVDIDLIAQRNAEIYIRHSETEISVKFEAEETRPLTEDERNQIIKETGWPKEIVDKIENMAQYEIYKNAGLEPLQINGRWCLCKRIDWDYVDEKTGMTNAERVAKGRVPIDSETGEKIELHHMGQEADSPFAELNENSEHGDGNHKILHPKTEDSWRNDIDKKNEFQNEKRAHWQERMGENK